MPSSRPRPTPNRRPTGSAGVLPLVVAAGLTISACADTVAGGGQPADIGAPAPSEAGDDPAVTTSPTPSRELPPPVVLDVPDPNSVYDPVRGGEPVPDGFRQVVARDAIAPVYDPRFVAASGVDWPEESLVIGVDLEGEARAYPVGFLNRREIVNDNHRGIPTLVTW